jgi:RNA polymerase sigma-70 factor (ECF subfamily)
MNGLNVARALSVAEVSDSTERLAVLFDAHYDRLYRLARRLTANTDDAFDLVQETFLKAAKSLKSIPVGSTNEEAWLVRVLINTRRDQWRKTSTRSRYDSAADVAADSRNFEASVIAKDTVWHALDGLSPRRRAIVVMHELEGLPISTVASLLGVSVITARWHLSKGKHDLVHMLKPRSREAK